MLSAGNSLNADTQASVKIIRKITRTLDLNGLEGLAMGALTLEDCLRNEESFGFELKDYPIEHQTQALLNISVKLRFIPEVKDDTSLYFDF